MMPKVDIIIPTFNNAGELFQCLEGFQRQTLNTFRCLICIDGSQDDTYERLSKATFAFPFIILAHPDMEHRGRNASRNLALPYLEADYLITIDSDMVPADNFVEKHVDFLSGESCIAQGKVVYLNKKSNPWADYIQSRGKNRFTHKAKLPPYYLTTGNVAMPVKCFTAIGGQDPLMTTYGGGDTEFAYRLHEKFKLPVLYNAQAVAYSEMNKNLNEAVQQMKEFGAVNLPYIRKKHPGFNALFHVHKLESRALHHRIFRRLLGRPLTEICLYWSQRTVGAVRRKMIHLLVFASIYQGYQSYLKKQTEMQ